MLLYSRKAAHKLIDPFTSISNFWNTLTSFIPILAWLPKYEVKKCLLNDVIGGFTTGIMHIPQGIAYATLSGVDPVYGLYSSFFPPLFYMIFGSSRHCSIGSFAVIALMSGIANDKVMSKYGSVQDPEAELNNSTAIDSFNTVTPIQVASTLTFALGILQLAAGFLRLEFLTTYFSDQLVAGYTTGSAVHVIIGQIDDILGIKVPKASGPGYLFRRVYDLIIRLPKANVFTLIISCLSMLFLYVGKEYINPLVNRCLPFKLPIPYEIILIAVGAAVSHVADFHGVYNTPIVGQVPSGMPMPRAPVFRILSDCFVSIAGVAVVSIAVHISMAKVLANKYKYKIDPGKEFYALGLTSTLSGFFPVYPTGTALGRTMVNVESGSKTQVTFNTCCLEVFRFKLQMITYYLLIQQCILSAIIVMALKSMLWKLTELKHLWPVSKIDFVSTIFLTFIFLFDPESGLISAIRYQFALFDIRLQYIWLFAFVVTVAVDVMEGLALSILFALLTVIFRFQWFVLIIF
uniref:Sulfate_transp domain-containing protein n=1 Tax=Syphacia muris TaxID=451379 RepID=A0A0N5ARD6_9BILA